MLEPLTGDVLAAATPKSARWLEFQATWIARSRHPRPLSAWLDFLTF